MNHPVPYQETKHGGNDTKEQKVQKNSRIEQLMEGSGEDRDILRYKEIIRNDCHKTIEENLPCNEIG